MIVPAQRANPLVYVYVVLASWALVPELRRIIDWKTAFSSVSIVSIVPLLALIPAAVALLLFRAGKLERGPLIVGWLWLGGFTYALAVAAAINNAPAAAYAFVGFVLPACFGLYLTTLDLPAAVVYERIAQAVMILAVPIALYALYQYAFPPVWDLLWIQSVALNGIGVALPFAFRPFSTLNGPGPLADFLIYALILNVPRFRLRPLWVVAYALVVAALVLTQVRADWLALVLAVTVLVVLGPNRLRNLSAITALAVAIVLLVANAGSVLGDDQAGADVQARFGTLSSISTDQSYLARQQLVGDTLFAALAQPLGSGLGVSGTAAKLGAAGDTVVIDNGYIARVTEMGWAGTAAYLAAIGLAFAITVRRRQRYLREGDAQAAAVAGAALALQAALIFLDVSGDHHSQLGGLFFWISFALACAPGAARVRG